MKKATRYFKLFVNGEPVEGPLGQLKRMAENTTQPYELFVYRKSCFVDEDIRKLAKENINRIIELRNEGLSLSRIACKYGCAKSWICELLRNEKKKNNQS